MNSIRVAALAMILTAFTLATVAQAANDILIDDFVSGRFDTWTVEGDAFGNGPLDIIGRDDMANLELLGDRAHPTGKGHEIRAEAMEPVFRNLLDGK
jgi:lysophospholipase L1-like esterase